MTYSKPLLILVVLMFCLQNFSQARVITKDEFYGPWRLAREKARTLNRRNSSHNESYRDSKLLNAEEWIYEYVLPDRIRYIHNETIGGTPRRTEQIDIGTLKYCRINYQKWERVSSPCIGGSGNGTMTALSEHYSVEDVQNYGVTLKRYRQYFTHRKPWLEEKDRNVVFFTEYMYWLRADGLIVYEEAKYGRTDPTVLERRVVDRYDFASDIKIEIPVN